MRNVLTACDNHNINSNNNNNDNENENFKVFVFANRDQIHYHNPTAHNSFSVILKSYFQHFSIISFLR